MPRKKAVKRNELEDLRRLANAFYENLEITRWEYGGIGLDPKRPFGNSDVCNDILRIIGWKPEEKEDGELIPSERQYEYTHKLYHERLIPYLQGKWIRTKQSSKITRDILKNIQLKNAKKVAALKAIVKDIIEALEGPAEDFINGMINVKSHLQNYSNEL